MSTTAAPIQTLHLQGIGLCPAKPASELAVGDRTVWNFGYVYVVTAVRQVSKCFIEIDHQDEKSGPSYTRRLKMTRLVAVIS